MTEVSRLLAAGNLTVAAAGINAARLNNAEGLSAAEQEQLSALQQVVEQASASLRAGRHLFTREDGSSTLGLLVRNVGYRYVVTEVSSEPTGEPWHNLTPERRIHHIHPTAIPYVYGCRQFDEGENLVWAPEGPCSGPCSSPDPCLRHSPNTGDEL